MSGRLDNPAHAEREQPQRWVCDDCEQEIACEFNGPSDYQMCKTCGDVVCEECAEDHARRHGDEDEDEENNDAEE